MFVFAPRTHVGQTCRTTTAKLNRHRRKINRASLYVQTQAGEEPRFTGLYITYNICSLALCETKYAPWAKVAE